MPGPLTYVEILSSDLHLDVSLSDCWARGLYFPGSFKRHT